MFFFEYFLIGGLLIVDLIIIYIVIKEIKALKKTDQHLIDTHNVLKNSVDAISASVRLLERDKIYYYLAKTAAEAKDYVHHLSVQQSTSEIDDKDERGRVKEFLKGLKTAKDNGKDVKILGPEFSHKIGGLYERKNYGGEVKVTPDASTYDIRIQVVDGEQVVIGVGPPEERSEHGFLIESHKLAQILDVVFMDLWEKAIPLDKHIEDKIMRFVPNLISEQRLYHVLKHELNIPDDRSVNAIINDLTQGNRILKVGDKVCSCDKLLEAFNSELVQKKTPSIDNIRHYYEGIGIKLTKVDEDTIQKFLKSKIDEKVLESGKNG